MSAFALRLAAGETVRIECWGGSTYFGVDPAGGQQMSETPPSVLQAVLRMYFGNTAAIVTNRGASGIGVNFMAPRWVNEMRNSRAHIIFINYGYNDAIGSTANPALSVDEYVEKLRHMVDVAQQTGKAVVLDTPHQVLQIPRMDRLERVAAFADAMRTVAAQKGVPLIDTFAWTHLYIENNARVRTLFPDRIHMSAPMAKARGYNMAAAIISPAVPPVPGPAILPATTSFSRQSGNASEVILSTPGRSSESSCVEQHRLPVWIGSSQLDLYLAFDSPRSAPLQATVTVDGLIAGTLTLDGSSFPEAIDQEVMVAENISPGFHVVQVRSEEPGRCVRLGYMRLHSSRVRTVVTGPAGDASGVLALQANALSLRIHAASGDFRLVTDLPVSRFLRDADVEIDAVFNTGQGFIVFAWPVGSNDRLRTASGALFFFLDSEGRLCLADGEEGLKSPQVLTSRDYRGSRHSYRVRITRSGRIVVDVGSDRVSDLPMLKPAFGGFVGLYSREAGTFVVDRIAAN